MPFFLRTLLCAAAVLAAAVRGEQVTEVTSESQFDALVEAHPLVLVNFYAPWCGHSKKFLPEFEAAGARLAEDGSPVAVANVDCVENEALYDRYAIRAFPTVKLLRNGVDVGELGGRTADTAVGFCGWAAQWAPAELFTGKQVMRMFAEERTNVAVVGVGLEGAAKEAFETVAMRDGADEEPGEDGTFGDITRPRFVLVDASAAEKLELPGGANGGTVVVLTDLDAAGRYVLPLAAAGGDFAAQHAALSAFVGEHRYPPVVEFTQENQPWLFNKRPGFDRHVIVFTESKDDDRHAAALEALSGLAGQFRDRALLVHAAMSESTSAGIAASLHVGEGDALPTVRVAHSMASTGGGMAIFKPDADFLDAASPLGLKDAAAWVELQIAGKLDPIERKEEKNAPEAAEGRVDGGEL